MKKIILLIVFITIAFSAKSTPTWVFSLKALHLTSHLDGTIQALFLKDGVVWQPCDGTQWYAFDVSKPGGNAMKSSLLVGITTKKDISLVYDCDTKSILAVRIDS